MDRTQTIQKFKRFINSIDNKDIIAVMPDTDVDGLSSGVLVYKCLEKIKNKTPEILQFQHTRSCITDDTMNYFKNKGVTKIIITDQAFDQVPEQIKEAESFADILIIDHHKFYNDLNSKKTTLIKSEMLEKGNEGSQYCAVKMVYDLFSEITDISEFDWIATLGIITDNNFLTFKTFVKKVLKKLNLKYNKDIFKTELGKAASILSTSGATNPPKHQLAFEILYSSKNIYSIIDSKLKNTYKVIQEEINQYVKNYKKYAEEYPKLNLLFIEVNSSFRIKSAVINKISIEKFPKKTIVVYSDANKYGEIKISARNQSAGKLKKAINVNEMLEFATKDLEGAAAGGHAPAAGASLKKENWEEFKNNIFKYIKKNGI